MSSLGVRPHMDNISVILEQARRGDNAHSAMIDSYIKGFPNIILRGAGKFGTAFGAFLTARGIPCDRIYYWDNRASELQEVNGIRVLEPFSTEFDRDETLIINCIPNGSLSGSVGEQEFIVHGYRHYFSGMALFEALMCSMNSVTGFDAKVCIKTTFCNWCACKRMTSLLMQQRKKVLPTSFIDELVFPVMTFVINQKCTLKCLHCGQYINHYSPEERINFSIERIKRDIDRISEAVDVIGYVSIIGGEPFLHPALNDIIDHLLTKANFGVIGVTTNGICKIDAGHLAKLNNDRIRLIFSDYTAALSDKHRRLFSKNIRQVSESGISFTVGQPLWSTPASLRNLNLSEATRVSMKSGCNSTVSCKTVQNGVYYPCSTTAGIGSHQLADYPDDWVIIDETQSSEELRKKILYVDERHFYESCNHCCEGGKMLALPGEQGLCDSYCAL